MSDERKRPGLVFWAAVVFALLPFYVLSSGPTQLLAVTSHTEISNVVGPDGVVRSVAGVTFGPSPWWLTTYAPLLWVTEQSWGEPLMVYWSVFHDLLGDE